MGKYTQTLFEYMESIDLDPFSEEDQIKAGRTLLKVEYDVPSEAMDNLLQRFVIRYINNEVAFGNINTFRMELMKYAVLRRPWYERMYGLFDDVVPDEFVEEVRERELTEDEERYLMRELKRQLDAKLHNRHQGQTDYSSILTNIDKERSNTNSGETRDENRTLDEDRDNTTTRTGGSKTTKKDTDKLWGKDTKSGYETTRDNLDVNNTNREIKGGSDKITRESRDANGFGSINNYAEPGIMVNDSTITDGSDTTRYNSDTTTIIEKDEDIFKHTDGKDTTTKDEVRNVDGTDTIERDETDKTIIDGGETEERNVSTVGNSNKESELSSQSTNRNRTRNERLNDELRDDRTNEDTSQANDSSRSVSERETRKGNNTWKMQLLREFYDLYIVIDDEWVRGARDLFSYIY